MSKIGFKKVCETKRFFVDNGVDFLLLHILRNDESFILFKMLIIFKDLSEKNPKVNKIIRNKIIIHHKVYDQYT